MSEQVIESGFYTAADQAYHIISQKILDGEFTPGTKLSRRKMAEVTGVSVIPVIEALNRLEDDGLVESKPKWGSFVTVPTRKKIQDMLVLREAIECMVARIIAGNIKPEDEAKLRRMGAKIDEKSEDEEAYSLISKTHHQFHKMLAEMTGYDSLVNTLSRINLFWILCKAISSTRERKYHPSDWHEQLIDVLVSGSPEEAEKMMRRHIHDSVNPILDAVSEHEMT